MSTRWHRGRSRSVWGANVAAYSPSPAAGATTNSVIRASSTGEQTRLRRVQTRVCIIRNTTAPAIGWYGWLRVPEDFSLTLNNMEPGNPAVLSPQPYVGTQTNDIIIECYYPAITLDPGESFGLLIANASSRQQHFHVSAKWYEMQTDHVSTT